MIVAKVLLFSFISADGEQFERWMQKASVLFLIQYHLESYCIFPLNIQELSV